MNDDFAILAAVAVNPAHPYGLLDHLHTAGIAVSRSTLYRRVEALVAQGWLQADDIRGESGHYRRALSLSKAGRARVEREARPMLESEPLESPLFGLALAVAGDSALLAKLLKPRIAAAARELTREERSARSGGEWSRPAQERRIAHLQADIAWLQRLLAGRVVAPGGEALRRVG